ncbi:glycosyltransferase [Paenibacillus sp. FSL L8-0436]|uniref:glycosyltransferase n=1 Tax=Paenibacillus sp. FSL L8-0436 TaxID=2954686 RepID=UPI0031583F39
MVKISVLLPVYNSSLYIEESIQSILQQSYPDFELLIIDDGSVDGTLGRIKGIHDSRIKVISHAVNIGLIRTLNEGLSLCTGEYIVRMDGDDIALPHRLARQVAFMDANPHIGVCGSQAEYIGIAGTTVKPLNHDEIRCWQFFHCTFVHPTVMLRKSILDNHGVKYWDYPHAEDFELWNRLGEVTQLTNLPEVLLKYRVHTNQISYVHETMQEQMAERIIRQQFGQIGLNPTYEEYQLHKDFCHFRIQVHDFNQYNRALAWAHKILEANNRAQKYNHEVLNSVLSQCFTFSQ